MRGVETSRVEGFSDAAFAFALTLLVISLEVPRSFNDLLDGMRGLPAFAICFAMLVWLWVMHYRFFRRYGLEDPITLTLNSALLFVIMFYVYPLKYVFLGFVGFITRGHLQPVDAVTIQPEQVCGLFVIYGVGFSAVFTMFGLMNLHAWRLREALQLNEVERLVTREDLVRCGSMIGMGLVSAGVALALRNVHPGLSGFAGFVYALSGVIEPIIGMRFGKAQEKALQAMRDRGEWPPA